MTRIWISGWPRLRWTASEYRVVTENRYCSSFAAASRRSGSNRNDVKHCAGAGPSSAGNLLVTTNYGAHSEHSSVPFQRLHGTPSAGKLCLRRQGRNFRDKSNLITKSQKHARNNAGRREAGAIDTRPGARQIRAPLDFVKTTHRHRPPDRDAVSTGITTNGAGRSQPEDLCDAGRCIGQRQAGEGAHGRLRARRDLCHGSCTSTMSVVVSIDRVRSIGMATRSSARQRPLDSSLRATKLTHLAHLVHGCRQVFDT